MLNKKNRIGNKKVIEKLFRKGLQFKTEYLVFKYEKAINMPSQFAVSVSKKIHKKATKRNRIRRQIYEAIRSNLSELSTEITALVIYKPDRTGKKIAFRDFDKCIKTFFNYIK